MSVCALRVGSKPAIQTNRSEEVAQVSVEALPRASQFGVGSCGQIAQGTMDTGFDDTKASSCMEFELRGGDAGPLTCRRVAGKIMVIVFLTLGSVRCFEHRGEVLSVLSKVWASSLFPTYSCLTETRVAWCGIGQGARACGFRLQCLNCLLVLRTHWASGILSIWCVHGGTHGLGRTACGALAMPVPATARQ